MYLQCNVISKLHVIFLCYLILCASLTSCPTCVRSIGKCFKTVSGQGCNVPAVHTGIKARCTSTGCTKGNYFWNGIVMGGVKYHKETGNQGQIECWRISMTVMMCPTCFETPDAHCKHHSLPAGLTCQKEGHRRVPVFCKHPWQCIGENSFHLRGATQHWKMELHQCTVYHGWFTSQSPKDS